MGTKIAIKVDSYDEFAAVINHFDPIVRNHSFMSGYNNYICPGIILRSESTKSNLTEFGYEVINFEMFSLLTGVKLPEKPKEVIIKWRAYPFEIVVTVKGGYLYFEFPEGLKGMVLNHTQLNELITALKSLEDE